MIENLIIMMRMIAFSYEYSRESGFIPMTDKGVSPQRAMYDLFVRS